MVYAECIYSVVVNRLCYALAHTNSPSGLNELKQNLGIPYLVYRTSLDRKIKFIKSNTDRPPKGVPDIIEACNIDLRNTIAHGGLVGKPAGVALPFFKDVVQMEDPTYVVRFNRTGSLESVRLVDLDAEYEKMRAATMVWHFALVVYWDLTFGMWSADRNRGGGRTGLT